MGYAHYVEDVEEARVDRKVVVLGGSRHLLASKSGEKDKIAECDLTVQDGRISIFESGDGGLSKVCILEREG